MFKGITLVSWSRRDGQAGLLEPAAIWTGVVWSLTSTAFICTALMLWVFMTTQQVYHFSTLLMVGVGLGALLGGAASGKTAGYLGWVHGLVVGFFYSLAVLLLLALWGTGLSAFAISFGYGLAVVILSAIGGVVGVNISAAKRGSTINSTYRKRFPA